MGGNIEFPTDSGRNVSGDFVSTAREGIFQGSFGGLVFSARLVLACSFCLTCSGISLNAGSILIKGEQVIAVIEEDGSKTSIVQRSDFEVYRQGNTNWSIQNSYPGVNNIIGQVNNEPFLLVQNQSNTSAGGVVLLSKKDLLEGVLEFGRILYLAFLANAKEVDNMPVPFLLPRHPDLYDYIWDVRFSSNSPFLPESIIFTQNTTFGLDANKAKYFVTSWTNFAGLTFPTSGYLRHDHRERLKVLDRLLTFTVTSVSLDEKANLRPILTTNSSVTHVFPDGAWQYKATESKWLNGDEAKQKGRFLGVAQRRGRTDAEGTIGWMILLLALGVMVSFLFIAKRLRSTGQGLK